MRETLHKTTGKMVLLCTVLGVIVVTAGCESLARKFIRKSKAEKEPVQMVLVPEEFTGSAMTKEERYRHYFFYWESWHDELVQSLETDGNKKKQSDAADEALKNLDIVCGLLNPEKQKLLDGYISRLKELVKDVRNDSYNTDANNLRSRAETLKMEIKNRFSYSDMKDNLL